LITLLVAILMIAVAAVSQQVVLRKQGPRPLAEVEPVEALQDSGPVMDLEHLELRDLQFLEQVLGEGTPEGRLSAARALVASGDLRGVPLLLDHAVAGDPQAMVFCVAAQEILRLQSFEDTWLMLVDAQDLPLDPGCRAELTQRFSQLSATHGDDLPALLERPEPELRVAALRQVADGPRGGEFLLVAVSDPDVTVRHAAWLLIGQRDTALTGVDLAALAGREIDPQVREIAQEVADQW
jgi:HEAT repeat protein